MVRETKVMAGGGGSVWNKVNKKPLNRSLYETRGSNVQFCGRSFPGRKKTKCKGPESNGI